jgi:hypothetical protein
MGPDRRPGIGGKANACGGRRAIVVALNFRLEAAA